MTPPASTASNAAGAASPRASGRFFPALAWLLPVLFLFWVWRYALRCWFIADDFAWLNLLGSVHSFRDFLRAMFSPMAQGTIRPWSERGFFMLFESLFGLDSLPWRLCVFFTAAADIFLISRLALRLTRSRLAALLAPVLWIANAALTEALCWTSVYNELLCPLFLLSALLLFIQWGDTGKAAWWWWQLAVFSLGFGALEINIVYPALAVSVCLVACTAARRRRLLRGTLPLFLISVIYFLVHRAAAPIPKTGVYVLHFDMRVFSTLALYWEWTMLPANWPALGIGRHAALAVIVLLSAAIAGTLVAGLRSGHREIFAGLLWYLIALAPLVPLSDHRSDYYLTIPAIGLAITAAQGFVFALRSAWRWRAAAMVALAVYLTAMVRMDGIASRWWSDRDRPIRTVVLGVAQARENHPNKAIVLDGVTDDTYNDAVAHAAFRTVGVDKVYMTPATAHTVHPAFDPRLFERLVMEPPVLRRALLDDSAVIYSVTADHLRNVTESFRRRVTDEWPDAAPRRIEIGNPLFAFALGPEWGPIESGFRRIPARASLRLGMPRPGAPGERHVLVLEGRYEAANPGAAGPHLKVLLDLIPAGETRLNGPNGDFYRLFSLPAPILQNRTARERELNVEIDLQSSSTSVSVVFLKTVSVE